MEVPDPTPLYRLVHIDNLATLVKRGGLHSPGATPDDGHKYRTIFGRSEQAARADIQVPCGPGGCLHDYVPFYFGPLSPMMLRLNTGQVEGYDEGQAPLVYCVKTVQRVIRAQAEYIFSDGHGLAAFTEWYDDIAHLDEVDWDVVGLKYWNDTPEIVDRQRRKQAEFLVHRFVPWEIISSLVVISKPMAERVRAILAEYPSAQKRVIVRRDWYY